MSSTPFYQGCLGWLLWGVSFVVGVAAQDSGEGRKAAINPFGTVEEFATVATRRVRFFIQSANSREPGIDEIEVFTDEAVPRNVASVSEGARFSDSGVREKSHRFVPEKAGDGLFGHANGWIANGMTNVWLEIEFPRVESINRVVWSRDRTQKQWDRTAIDYRVEVEVSNDEWKTLASSEERLPGLVFEPIEVPVGEERLTPASDRLLPEVNAYRNVEEFSPIEARYVRFTSLPEVSQAITLDELEVYSPASASLNLALAGRGAVASSSNSDRRGEEVFSPAWLNDGLYGADSDWRSVDFGGAWAQVDLQEVVSIHRVVWSRDRTGKRFDRTPTKYRIEVAKELGEWQEVASSSRRRSSQTLDFLVSRRPPAEHIVDVWEGEEGLPLNQINDINQTPDGYLWLATESGLLRFDGNQFTHFNQNNTPVLSTPRIPALHVDSSGRLWIVNRKFFYDSRNNLVVYENGEFQRIEIQGDHIATSFFEDRDSTLWVLSNLAAIPWRGEDFDYGSLLSRLSISTLEYGAANPETGKKRQWEGIPGRWVGGEFLPMFGFDGRPYRSDGEVLSVRQIGRRDGGGWILEGGIRARENLGPNRWRIISSEGELTDPKPFPWGGDPFGYHAVVSDRSDNLWVFVAGRGLYCLRADGERHWDFSELPGLEGVRIRKLFEDGDGNIWVATEDEGLKRVRQRLFKCIDERQGMSTQFRSTRVDNVYTVAPASQGGVWIGTHSSSAYHWKDGTLSHLLDSFSFTWSVLEDSRGNIWTGAYGRNARRHRDGEALLLPTVSPHPFCFLEDRQQRMWMGGDFGLAYLDEGMLSNVVPPQFSRANFEWVISLAEDRDGSILLGTKLGFLHRFHEGVFETLWVPEKGREYPICSLHIGPSGGVWMARFGMGLSRMQDGTFAHYSLSDGLPAASINGILDDQNGSLWMSSKQGVYRITYDHFEQFSQGDTSQDSWQQFTEKDGLPSNQCHGEQNQPSLCQTEDGRVWVPTLKGVGFIDPSVLDQHGTPPPVVIQEVVLYGDDNQTVTLLSDGEFSGHSDSTPIALTLPPGNNNLLIRYTGIDFTEPKQMNFRYRILGLEGEWVDAKNERSTLIASLGSGSYQFELSATNHRGQMGGVARLGIVVQPFWWETAVFRILLVGLIFGAALTIYSIRVRQLTRLNRLQTEFSRRLIEREESERKRISQEPHDSLGHELLLVRNRALDGANQADSDEAREQFEGISDLTGRALENTRGMAYNLRPFELDRIGFKKAVEAMISKTSDSSGTRYFKDIDELDGVLTNTSLIYLYRLIQEGLNNILKHAEASVVMLEVKREDDRVRLQLDDNGKGFDPSGARVGLGLSGMEERAKLLGGEFQLASAPGEGTRIRIVVPISGH